MRTIWEVSQLYPTKVPFRHAIHWLRAPEEFGVAVSGVELRVDFLTRQGRPTRVEQVQTQTWSLDLHEAHVRARVLGPIPPGWFSIGMMRTAVPSAWYGVQTRLGTLACSPHGTAIDGWIAPGFSCVAANLSASEWERCRLLAGVERGDFGGAMTLHVPERRFAAMEQAVVVAQRQLAAMSSHPIHAESALACAHDVVIEIGTTAWELSSTPIPLQESLRNRVRIARRAEEWMRAHLGEPVRMPDLCTALGVSRREMEYAARTVWDQSPRDMFQTLRLNAIRRALKHEHRSITRVAMDHGLTHLGRFSAQYRALFAETPRETTRR